MDLRRLLIVPVLVTAVSCGDKITQTKPAPSAVAPKAACAAQKTSAIKLTGTGFSPLPTKTLNDQPALALPQISLNLSKDVSGAPASGSHALPDDAASGHVRWASQQEMSFDVYPGLNLGTGLYDVQVTNADGETGTLGGGLLLVPPPTASKVAPDVLCSDQANVITLSGDFFLESGSALPVVAIAGGSLAAPLKIPATALATCRELPGASGLKACTGLTFALPSKALTPGNYKVTVTNPDPAGCTSTQPLTLTLVPEPTLAKVVPDLACTAQGDRNLVLTGTGFLTVNGASPTVTVGADSLAGTPSNCSPVTGPAETVTTCTTLTVTVPRGSLAPGNDSVVVKNPPPADCSTMEHVDYTEVPPPTLSSASPDLACDAQGAQTITLAGSGFLEIGTTTPKVTFTASAGGTPLVVSATTSGCTPITGPANEAAQSCGTLKVSLPQGALGAGTYTVVVTNPDPVTGVVGCDSTQAVTLSIVSPPTVASVSSPLFCNAAGAVTLTVSGTNFVQTGTTTPTVVLHPSAGADVALPSTSLTGCAPVTGPAAATQLCTGLSVSVPSSVAAGTYQVIVQDPSPVTCASTDAVFATIFPAPAVATVQPNDTCNNSATTAVTVTGTNFLKTGTAAPSVVLTSATGTRTFPATLVDSSCTAVAGVTPAVSSCTALTFTLSNADAASLGNGTDTVVVTNPAPASCSSPSPSCPADNACFTIAPPPQVASLGPAQLCAAGGNITLTGTGLLSGTLTLTSTTATVAAPVTANAAGTSAVAAVPSLQPGTYQATYTVGGGACTAVAAGGTAAFTQTITVTPGPQIFFAAPRVVYNGITTEVTFYVGGIQGTVNSLALKSAAGALTPLTGFSYANNQVRALLPAGQAPGTYSVVLTDNSNCGATLPNGLVVTSTVVADVVSITPPFGFKSASTPVTITGSGPGVFQPLPQAYLSPVNASAGTVATAISALALNQVAGQPDTLTGVVRPPSPTTPLTVGVYDLIVVNPDGTVGFLANAFTVTDAPVPTIVTVSPGSFPGGTNTSLAITGANFVASAAPTDGGAATRPDGGAALIASVDLLCVAAGTSAAPTDYPALSTTVNGSGSITALVNAPTGDICVVRVTNPDGVYADFSAVATTNASGNLAAFLPGVGPDGGFEPPVLMTTGRAELAATAGNATSAARFLYAIGGTDGTRVLDSVEFAPVSVFGVPSSFQPERYPLTEGPSTAPVRAPRARGTAVNVGRYIYLVGGQDDGGAPMAQVDRAEILDPAEAPQVDDLAIQTATTGLAPGVYYYQVAAVKAATDASNPGGETLPGDPFGVEICDPRASTGNACPNLEGRKLQVTLTWTTVPNAAAYAIYRTALPNQSPAQTVLLGTVPASQVPLAFTDTGVLTLGSQVPLAIGSLGRWSTVSTLTKARSGPAVTSAVDPGDPTKVYLYAFGGLTTGNTLLGDYDLVPLTLNADGTQSVGAGVHGSSALVAAGGGALTEWLNLAFTGTNENAPTIPAGQTYVYVGPGALDPAGTSATSSLDYATLGAGMGGQLSPLAAFGKTLAGSKAGYAGALEAGYLNIFGGGVSAGGPSPSGTFVAGKLLSPPTSVQSFNNNGTALRIPRVEMATAVQSGTIFVLGGFTAGNPEGAPTNTVEFTYW